METSEVERDTRAVISINCTLRNGNRLCHCRLCPDPGINCTLRNGNLSVAHVPPCTQSVLIVPCGMETAKLCIRNKKDVEY